MDIQKQIPTNTPIPHTPMKFLWYVSKPHKKYMIGGFLAVILAEVCSTSIPYVFKSIIDNAQRVSIGTSTVTQVWFWVIAYPLIVALMFLSWRMAGFIGAEWATRTNATAYKTLFNYLTNHSHSYFSNRFAGSLSSKVTHASEGTQSLAESLLWNYFPTTLSLVFTIVYIGFSSIAAAGIFVLLIIVLIPINLSLVKHRRPHINAYAEQATRARGYAVDTITNISAVRQFSRKSAEQEKFTDHINTMRRLNIRQWRLSEWILIINNIIIVLFEAIMLYIVVKLWIAHIISIGELVMIVTLIMNVQNSLVFIGGSINGFIRRFSDIQEGIDDIIVDHEITDIENARQLIVENGHIEWKNVTFRYQSGDVFTNFNLTIRANERIGLVGSSGAGKTTFVSLLLRQHELNEGGIYIDGHNIAHVTQDSLREHIAVVPQEPLLFHRSIRENIMYGNPNATEAEMIAVAEKAQAHEFITKLPEGYDTMVGERGVKLSGGQKQRVAIARAMLKDAPILILDEATSALDSESEVAIQKALHTLMEGKTVIAIAHRLSTLREMDRIIVLEDGKIIEDGTHDTLAKSNGLYARLWEHQAGGFLLE